ncbi:MAG: UvrD-helicase domain-containing protein [Oscillospiraceae bacterium]|nr:UvrD-helicase domain-containing protein [Oscillospiraceae bacterium]
MNYTELKRSCLERYFSNLNPEQRKAVFTVKGPVLILAGAGSGKTTVLVNRIANMIMFGNAYNDTVERVLSAEDEEFMRNYEPHSSPEDDKRLSDIVAVDRVNPWNILAITFTNKAANELKTRLINILGEEIGGNVNASTFHSACARILRCDIDKLGYYNSFTIYDADDSKKLIKKCIEDAGLDTRFFSVNYVATEISNAKNSNKTPDEYEKETKEDDYRKRRIAGIYQEYMKRLKASNALDFDDLIMKTNELFITYPKALEKYAKHYKYILVDEYQDTNRAQSQLVQMLIKKQVPPNYICVVGDDDQSIYKFRGADVQIITDFADLFSDPDCVVIKLEQNYRSRQNILSAANSVISKNKLRQEKNLWSDRGDGEKVKICSVNDDHDEVKLVIDEIKRLTKDGDYKYSDFVVLYRMNAQSNLFEQGFSSKKIPYKVVGGLRFYDRKEIKDILAYLSLLCNEFDIVRFSRVINEPKRNIGNATLEKITEISVNLGLSPLEVMRQSEGFAPLQKKSAVLTKTAQMFDYLTEFSKENSLEDIVEEVLKVTGYKEMLENEGDEGQNRLDNIYELKSNIRRYTDEMEDEGEEAEIEGFLENVSLYSSTEDMTDDENYVSMMTIHTAKGLEYPIVFVVGMESGIFPSERSSSIPEDIQEERRLCYVAMTRAKEMLYLSYAQSRLLFGRTQYNRRSCFIGEIDPRCIEKYPEKVEDITTAAKVAAKPAGSAYKPSSYSPYVVKNTSPMVAGSIDFEVGDRVYSPKFKEGTVLSAKYIGNDNLLEVAFDETGTKKIMARMSRLKKI